MRLTFSRLDAAQVALEEADAILCTGLNDDRNETADDYRPLLEKARARNLPFVCANPDLVVDVGGRQYLCAGAIADLYERMDGSVFWAGKPHANAYAAARAAAERLRGRSGAARADHRHRRQLADRSQRRGSRRNPCDFCRLRHSPR